MNVILYIQNRNPDASFHYGRKQGGDITFSYNRQRDRHEAKFTLEEWRENNFYIAQTLLDQTLIIPILFDVEEDIAASCVAATTDIGANSDPDAGKEIQQPVEPEASPVGSGDPPAKRAKKSRLTDEQRTAAQAAYEVAQNLTEPAPLPSFIPK